ncbi:10257_t:CDS:10 [Paraglomus brasilianum]|uniref:10257_t:CDS:1 n=1 Tax=Paraglomus brasilianum TaxID=144538 RepID=A0A9N8WI63_9GLOM|nr:10257_t:CDS:10 [Paraglomus brasilianum]
MEYNQRSQRAFNFPCLKASEIPAMLNDLNIPFTEEDVNKPNPVRFQTALEVFANGLLGVTLNGCRPQIDSALEGFDYRELHSESTAQLAFAYSLRKLMAAAGIDDYCIRDVLKPEPGRVRMILSGIINFARFHEDNIYVLQAYMDESENVEIEHQNECRRRQELIDQLGLIKLQHVEEEPAARQFKQANIELGNELKGLKRQQNSLSGSIENMKKILLETADKLQANRMETLKTQQDIHRLEARIVQSDPEELKSTIKDLENGLAADKAACSELEKKLRKLQLKVARVNSIHEEIISCDKYIDDVESERAKRDKANKAIQQSQDRLAHCQLMLRDKETEEKSAHKTLDMNKEKLQRLQQRRQSMRDKHQKKIASLEEEYKQVKEREAASRELMKAMEEDWQQRLATINVRYSHFKAATQSYLRDILRLLNSYALFNKEEVDV